jgi:hypothetical protein
VIRVALALFALCSLAAAEPLIPSVALDNDAITESVGCDDGLRVSARRRLAGHDVRVLHECGSSDGAARLALGVDDRWRVFASALIAYRGANMTDAPLHVTLVGEHDTFAKLGTRRVWLHRTDTLHRAIRMDGSVESEKRERRVDVCSYADGEPTCSFAIVECPSAGCRAVTLRDRAVWIGAEKFTLN